MRSARGFASLILIGLVVLALAALAGGMWWRTGRMDVATPVRGSAPLEVRLSTLALASRGGTYRAYFGDGSIDAVASSTCFLFMCSIHARHTYRISGTFQAGMTWSKAWECQAPAYGDCIPPPSIGVGSPATVTVSGGITEASIDVATSSPLLVGESIWFEVRGSGSTLSVDYGDRSPRDPFPVMTEGDVATSHRYFSPNTYVLKVLSGDQVIATKSIVVQ